MIESLKEQTYQNLQIIFAHALGELVGIANVNLSKIKTGKVSAIRFSTLEAICEALGCQPGDILEYSPPRSE